MDCLDYRFNLIYTLHICVMYLLFTYFKCYSYIIYTYTHKHIYMYYEWLQLIFNKLNQVLIIFCKIYYNMYLTKISNECFISSMALYT